MNKIALTIAAMALVFASVSCSKKQAAKTEEMPADLAMFQNEEEGLEWESTGEKLTGASCNTLAADTGVGVTIVVDKDISKGGTELQGADVEVVEFLGEKCLKVTANYNPEIRIAFVFDKPITTEAFKGIKFACAGEDGGAGTYNCGLMYTTKPADGGEYPMSFYMADISTTEWIECNANFVADEQWGNNYSADKEIQAIQFWSGIKGPLFIKGLSFVK